ncbi:MAG: thiol-disulfide oxidoreductase DCC family protein [Ginsengibacter sp.]
MMRPQPIILFDGVCNFCNAIVNFIITQDTKKVFLFAALQSRAGKQLLEQYKINWMANDSFVVIENAKAYQKSTAVLRLYNKLAWYWKWSQIFWIIPKFIRDAVYNLIAKNRYKWFGKKDECIIPTAQLRARFLN